VAGHERRQRSYVDVVSAVSTSDVERRLHDEIDTVLGGRLPTADDVVRLPYTERFSLRR